MGKKLFALGAVAVMVAVALATACVVDDGECDARTVNAGTEVYVDSFSYECPRDQFNFTEDLTCETIFGIKANIKSRINHDDDKGRIYFTVPQYATGAMTYTEKVYKDRDFVVGKETNFSVAGTYGLTSDTPINDKIEGIIRFSKEAFEPKTIYVLEGTQFNLTIINGVKTLGHDVILSNSVSGLSVNDYSIGGIVTGTLTGNVTIQCNGDYGTYTNSATYNIVVVKTSPCTHTVHYNAGGGTGVMADTAVTDNLTSTAVTLPECTFTKTGYKFTGWLYNGTVYQKGETIPVGESAITVTAQWCASTITINPVAKQYAVCGSAVSFAASVATGPEGESVSFAASNVPSALNVGVNGDRITCASSTVGTYTFTLNGIASGYSNGSTKVTVEFVPVLAFTNTPAAGALNA